MGGDVSNHHAARGALGFVRASMDRHRDVEQVFAYTEPTPKDPGEFASFVQLFRDKETGELVLVTRARDLRFVSIDLPAEAARGLGTELMKNWANGLPITEIGFPLAAHEVDS